MQILFYILAALVLIAVIVFTKRFWDKPKESVDMLAKFDTVLKKGYALGAESRLLELRENFVKVGVKNMKGEKAIMVKQRPENEFKVIYISKFDSEYEDLKIEHIYKDDADQKEIIIQFTKEIEASLVKRNK